MAAVPVDRELLSQQLLPALPNFYSIGASESTPYKNTSTENETHVKSNQLDSQTGPSLYELRLDDQKAWRSQPRRANLVSTRQPVGSSEIVTIASSESPIVPGHNDPHLWYESQHMELASLEVQQMDQLIANDPNEFTELPELSPEDTLSATLQLKPLPVKALPLNKVPAKAGPANAGPMARAWETGRY